MKRRDSLIQADIAVIGAGVAGLSTAYHLARSSKSLRVVILEQERALGGHASGRNAGMIRQTVTDPFLAKLAKAGRRELSLAPKNGWKGLSFQPNGSLLLGKKDKVAELKKIKSVINRLGITAVWLSRQEAAAKVPLLRDGDFEKALFCPSDALVEIRPLLNGFYSQLKKCNVKVFFNTALKKIECVPGGFRLQCGRVRIEAKKIVNAAGAWCALLAEEAGAQKIALQAYRRHLYLTGPLQLGQSSWPFVWDLSSEFYFRPEGSGLLLSPCDKAVADKKALGSRSENENPGIRMLLADKLSKFSPVLARIAVKSAKSGLRTMTNDGRFVIGADARLQGFYWVAGLGGHGVTTCFSAGKLSSDIILGKRVDPLLARAFNPGRFLGKHPK